MIKMLKEKTTLTNLIYINVAVFFVINLLKVFTGFFQKNIEIISYVCVPSNIDVLIKKPWTLITYMFIHQGFFHITVNLLFLYFGGRIFLEYLSSKKLISTYLMGGIVGAIIYIVCFNIFPFFEIIKSHSLAMGASASAMAILVAAATYVPSYPVMQIPMRIMPILKLKHIAIAAITIDILSISQLELHLIPIQHVVQNGNIGGHIAHLGGALYGFTYISFQKRNINTGYLIEQVMLLFSKKNTTKRKKRTESDYEYNARKKEEQAKINTILEKISRSGYDSLSSEEKDELFKHK